MPSYSFPERHIGPDDSQIEAMLSETGVSSLDDLINKIIPTVIRLHQPLALHDAQSEADFLRDLRQTANRNMLFRNYIGMGYYDCITPGVILRNILENPGWYTAYTPYQAEISQGRMEALLNFQTLVTELTGMDIANASLLDEATAAAEAMNMFFHSRSKEKQLATKFFIDQTCFPQTRDVVTARAVPLGIEVIVGESKTFVPAADYFGALLQYPNGDGQVVSHEPFINSVHQHGIKVVVAADLMSLMLLKPPGTWGVDAVVGSTQRFGVPLGYGGPHAAYFAAKEIYKRDLPGRIIGVSVDAAGNPALRMALQTREQHIRREKATSNICTAQVLLAVMAGMYAVYHGPQGLRSIASSIHRQAVRLASLLKKAGWEVVHEQFFDTVKINSGSYTKAVNEAALQGRMNFRYENQQVLISLDETVTDTDIHNILLVFARAKGTVLSLNGQINAEYEETNFGALSRKPGYLKHEVFNKYHSETEMLRYITRLENKDLSLNHSMIPLGSCTMKLNATAEMIPLSWNHFSRMHPFQPVDQVQGYAQVIEELQDQLKKITGFDAVSLQPNSGAQGEYAGLMVIRAYLDSIGQQQRNMVLIPSSAHGTNPASAVLAGFKIAVVRCDDMGNIDLTDLKAKAELHKTSLAALMVTYPSTHGVYEESIREITAIIHQYGGQVYMDGANMNAQVGLTNPASIGADVCHLNLHKTFAIPHGGGGPGMGPIAVAAHLAPFLPAHPLIATGGSKGIKAVAAAPWGSASILLISYAYIKMMGGNGLTHATRLAILNANYILKRLENHYPVLYKGKNGFVAHELILDCRAFKQSAGIEVIDIAKRLMDYGFHAPTVAFPVAGTLMVEPTESESKEELDRFCDAMIRIRHEIASIESGLMPRNDNPLVNAPHTASEIASETWNHPYSRQDAVFPAPWLRERKFWVPVKRVDNAFGDRNLICTCPTIESYSEPVTG